jgi:hypothetical protein
LAYARTQFAQAKPKRQKERAQVGWEGALDFLSKNVLSPVHEAIIGAGEGVFNTATAVTDPILDYATRKTLGDDVAKATFGAG